jgi:hypothetical protein
MQWRNLAFCLTQVCPMQMLHSLEMLYAYYILWQIFARRMGLILSKAVLIKSEMCWRAAELHGEGAA